MEILNEEIKERIDMINRGEVPEGYKKTKRGIIPEEWEVKKLEQITIGKGKYGANAPAVSYSSELPKYLRITDISVNGNLIKEEQKSVALKEYEKYVLKKNDIVFARTGNTTGKTYLYDQEDGELVYAGFLIKFSMNPEIASSKFIKLYTETSSYWNWVKVMSTRSGQPGINSREYGKLLIPLPPLPEQQKIAQILSTWDQAIELKEKLIEEKKEQKKGLMQNFLTGKVRLPGFEGEWEEVKLGEVVKRVKGKVVKYDVNGDYPVIDMEYFDTGEFNNYTSEKGIVSEKDDVLLLWDGAKAGKSFTSIKGVVGSTFVKLECQKINNVFLQNHFELNEKFILSIREGSGIPHVPKDFLEYYKIYSPSLQEQKAIANILSTADKEINLHQQELEQLKQQKKGLMQLLLTGKVRVNY